MSSQAIGETSMHARAQLLRRGLLVAGFTGGLLVLGIGLGAGTASADETSGQDGILSGNQSHLDVTAPVEVSGNQVTVIGRDNSSAGSGSGGSGAGGAASDGADSTDGRDGAGSGNQTDGRASAPVEVSGNQVTVIGRDNSSAGSGSGGSGAGGAASDGADSTDGRDGAGSGNQTHGRVTAPVEASDNQVTVIGRGNSSGGSDTPEPTDPGPTTPGPRTPGRTIPATATTRAAVPRGRPRRAVPRASAVPASRAPASSAVPERRPSRRPG